MNEMGAQIKIPQNNVTEYEDGDDVLFDTEERVQEELFDTKKEDAPEFADVNDTIFEEGFLAEFEDN